MTLCKLLCIFWFMSIINALPPFLSGRIVNGTDSYSGEFPFVVSIRGSMGYHSCGGSIISPEWILTAGHCVPTRNISFYSVQYGTNEISVIGNTISKIDKIIVHEHFNLSNQYLNDIALFKLKTPLILNDKIKTVKLAKHCAKPISGTYATLIGWGLNATNGSVQSILQKVDLKVILQEECAKIHWKIVHKNTLCAEAPGQSQCSGDSGGPLLVDGIQIGIVSWSMKPCSIAPFPGVFTLVSAYRNWIKIHTGV